jgi:23S rRNA pseudouridine1911/1915/1917 synthase
MADEKLDLRVEENENGVRLDRFLVNHFPDHTRSVLRKWIDTKRVLVDGNPPPKAGLLVSTGMQISVTVPPPETDTPQPEEIPLDILFEDDHLVVINKAAGMVVHPAQAYPTGTLVNALLGSGIQLSKVGERGRPGIVHRLDRDTSGVIVAAKTEKAHYSIATMFSERKVQKTYHALVWGSLDPPEGQVDRSIGRSRTNPTKMEIGGIKSRRALTLYRTLETLPGFSWLEINLMTGRTHQIRVHLQSIHHPVVGDPVYGGIQWKGIQNPALRSALKKLNRQVLHASELSFNHPVTGEEVCFKAPFPPDLEQLLDVIRS